jgi:thiol:disulfide interchange protein DsbD
MRGTTIALALAAFHFASMGSNIVTKVHAQGLVPSLLTDPDPKDLVRAELIADAQALAPGRPFRLAVRLVMKEGWHVNWLNPGDAGLAPSVAWRLPKGFKSDLMCWPAPGRFPAGPLVIFGYAGELLLSIDVTPPVEPRPGAPVELVAEVSWLACAEACVPGSASLSLTLPVEATSRSNASILALIEDGRKRCPAPSGEWSVDARIDDRQTMQLVLQTAADTSATVNAAVFYPYEQGIVENAAPQLLSVQQDPLGRNSYQLRIEVSRVATHVPERLSGVLVIERSKTDGGTAVIEVDVPLRTR